MDLKIYQTGPLNVNTYLLTDNDSKEAVLIDVGGSFETIKKDIYNNGYNLKFILNTHGHFDHVIGETEIQQNYPDIPIYMHKDDAVHLTRFRDELNQWGFNYNIDPIKPTAFIDENDNLSIGNTKIKILRTPGHSKGSLSYYIPSMVFTGDALFQRCIGRTDFFGGDFNTLINSIKEKLFTLPDDTKVFPGHGPSSVINEEKKYNTYLK